MAEQTETPTERRTVSAPEWFAEGARLFGADRSTWLFRCPVCGYVACAAEWQTSGAPESAVAFSCVGRWREGSREAFDRTKQGPCNYAGGGLFRLNPVTVVDGDDRFEVFEFASPKDSQ